MLNNTKIFLQKESTTGFVLIAITIIVLLISNSSLANLYHDVLSTNIAISVGHYTLSKHLYHWINEGLMTVFFFSIGLELKREFLIGDLSSWDQASLPVFAALGGIIVPALIFILFNITSPKALAGWAIPTATDIAFALAVFLLLSKNVPTSLKIFLLSLAIIDDLVAIIVIAIFYTAKLSITSIIVSWGCVLVLIIFNRCKIARKTPYVLVGIVLWLSVLKSGVHATLSGVILAICIPFSLKAAESDHESISESFESDIHYWVDYLVLPAFVFVNAGVMISDISLNQIMSGRFFGIMLGLFVGKQLGVFVFSYLAIRMGLAKLPRGANWLQFYSVCVLTGIGFTMSLFIASLAFPVDMGYQQSIKLAILLGSALSAIVAYVLFRRSNKKHIQITL
jgi:NhaA family Na+:H+ antiporter